MIRGLPTMNLLRSLNESIQYFVPPLSERRVPLKINKKYMNITINILETPIACTSVPLNISKK